jgi:nucleotide-binding universal stress UspA family protein
MSSAVGTSDEVTLAPQRSRDGRIVVGVDGSEASLEALRWAVDQARLTGADVDAVQVYSPRTPTAFAFGAYPALAIDPALAKESAEVALDAAVHRALPEYADDEVSQFTVADHSAARALTRLAAEAAMLVVGVVHHHGLGLLLGSTASTCIRHTTVPVVVVPYVDSH